MSPYNETSFYQFMVKNCCTQYIYTLLILWKEKWYFFFVVELILCKWNRKEVNANAKISVAYSSGCTFLYLFVPFVLCNNHVCGVLAWIDTFSVKLRVIIKYLLSFKKKLAGLMQIYNLISWYNATLCPCIWLKFSEFCWSLL